MRKRFASINDLPIEEKDRKLIWYGQEFWRDSFHWTG
jgi:nuclear transport factor 2 (NTF2) superfamily protein